MTLSARSLGALLACLGLSVAVADMPDAAVARRSYLAEELAAARSQQFYLVFDEAVPALDLKIEGVRVHRFALDRAEFGQSRLAGTSQRQWPAVSFSLVSELPEPDRPRIEIQQADAADKTRDALIKQAIAKGQQPVAELSQTAGERVARLSQADDGTAPMTFRLQFDPDLVLVVRGEPRAMDFTSRIRRIRYRLEEGWQGLFQWLGGKTVATRVVVYLPPEHARRLFKVLTPQLRLLVYAPPIS
jgi:hypothetical protein